MKQTIDISPEKVGPIAAAGIRFLNLETTLIPGNLKQQLAVLEVFLTGLTQGELILATPAQATVESDANSGEGSDKKEPTPEEFELMKAAARTTAAAARAGEEKSG